MESEEEEEVGKASSSTATAALVWSSWNDITRSMGQDICFRMSALSLSQVTIQIRMNFSHRIHSHPKYHCVFLSRIRTTIPKKVRG